MLISYSGHGYTRERNYYLFPYDTGKDIKAGIPDTSHRISDIELVDWLRDIDAGGLIMILDTCYSGTIVGEGFKPELFSSPGLGQLAYDKGMLVLASTGENQVAFESSKLRMSILTYAQIGEHAVELLPKRLNTSSSPTVLRSNDQPVRVPDWLQRNDV